MSERPHDGPLREGSTFLVMAPYTRDWKGGVPEIRHNQTVWLNNHGYSAVEGMPRDHWYSQGWEERHSVSLGFAMQTNHAKLRTMAQYSFTEPTELPKHLRYTTVDVIEGHQAEQYASCYVLAGARVFLPWTVDVITEHADATIEHIRKFAAAAEGHKSLGLGTIAVVNGEEMKRKYEIANGAKYTVVPNPINVDQFNPKVKPIEEIAGVNLQDGKKNIVFVGRLEKRKGLDMALRAISLLVSEPNAPWDFRFIIAGSGSEGENLKELAKELCIEKYVVFAGEVSAADKPGLYTAADFLFLPSVSDESAGLTVAEGEASSRAVLAGPAYKVGKLVVHGKTGFQMKSADPHEAEKYLKIMLGDADTGEPDVNLEIMGALGREYISQFSEDIIFQRRVDIVNEVRMWKLRRYHNQRTFFYVPEIPVLHKAMELVWKNPVKS